MLDAQGGPSARKGERDAKGVDKIQKYKWVVVDAPGRFVAIPKEKLLINHEDYQRLAADAKVLEIASEWSWAACGAIIVGHRDGRYWVLDGQYRLLAALRRSDITAMPCMVFEMKDVREEAIAFLRANTNRKPITSRDRFKALISTEDDVALFVQELLEASSRTTDDRGGGARCLTALMSAARLYRAELVRIWPVIDKLCAGHPVHVHLLKAMIYVERHMPEGMSLADKKWRQRVLDAGFDEMLEFTRKAANLRDGGGDKVWAEGIVIRLNKGLQNKLIISQFEQG